MKIFSSFFVVATLISVAACAEEKLTVSDAWTTAPLTSKGAMAVYFTIKNEGGGPALLKDVSTPFAKRAELHESSKGKDGVMQMKQVKEVKIAAGESVEFKPHGLHVMLFDIKEMPAEGATFPLSLQSVTSAIEASVTVKPLEEKSAEPKKHQCH